MAEPIMRYFGSKWRIAPWVVSHFPKHKIYVEPFGGSGAVLFHKPKSPAEIYNDTNSKMVNLFRVLQDPVQTKRLMRMAYYTLFSRDEYTRAWNNLNNEDPVIQAWATIVMSFSCQGHSALRLTKPGFYRPTDRNGKTSNCTAWHNLSQTIYNYRCRWIQVIVENKNAIDLIREYNRPDNPNILIYCDPPYLPETFNDTHDMQFYGKESVFRKEDHVELLTTLNRSSAMILISGYPSKLYDEMLKGWKMFSKAAVNQKGGKRQECLWLNPAAARNLQSRTTLF